MTEPKGRKVAELVCGFLDPVAVFGPSALYISGWTVASAGLLLVAILSLRSVLYYRYRIPAMWDGEAWKRYSERHSASEEHRND